MHSFTELEAWKKSRLLRIEISKLCKSFPPEEKYRLCDQIIRSSRSIRNNIAEGHGRFHFRDASKFLLNARGSACETLDHLIIALDEGFINQNQFETHKSQTEECLRLINGFINYLRSKLESST